MAYFTITYIVSFPVMYYRGLHSIWSKTSSRLWPVLLIRIVVVVFNNHRFTRGNSAVEHNKMVMSYTGNLCIIGGKSDHFTLICRAYLTGNSDTLLSPQLLALIQDWVTKDGTFLYTYHGRIRLGLDPLCPLEITSFSQPECQGHDLYKNKLEL